MSRETHLAKAAFELAKVINKAVDEHLPERLASIVKLHAGVAVGAAFIPIPGADIAAAAANTWTMYVRLNKELEIPFGENVMKSLAAGVITNIGSSVAGLVVFASALKIIPGLGTFGGAAIMATTIYALTIAAGIIYMKALTKLLRSKSQDELTEDALKNAADEILKDKDELHSIVKEAKASYKKEPANSRQSETGVSETPNQPGSSPLVPPLRPLPPPPPPPPPSESAQHAYVATGGKTYGPYPIAEIRRMFTAGQLASDAHYWRNGMNNWIPVVRL